MKNFRNVSFMLFICILLSSVNAFSQLEARPKSAATGRPDKSSQQGKDQPQVADSKNPQQPQGGMNSGYCLITAAEQSGSKFAIQADFGNDKEGKPRAIFQTDKEKDMWDQAIKRGSVIDVINILSFKGFDVVNSYAVFDAKLITHYFLLQQSRKGGGQRSGMSPEELEKLRKEREQQKEMQKDQKKE
ncbi:MAG: hypothetical protein NTW49_01745 [Bacteroidia bacterium]|nr:hypothetical protein [Bacteroidia bacterium]